ncbi:MAG: response regulator [Spirochaetales bacterium]|jgi:CheY-like chemotaxis protein|nr:response regulator [Spirochaetales bacterium]
MFAQQWKKEDEQEKAKKVGEYTVLIVDDTETNVDILVELLADSYEISVALDGETALEIVDEDSPDLILLDIKMPGMDGFEVCQRLKSDDKTAQIPIIFISGEPDEKDAGLQAGVVDFLTKPIDPDSVLEAIKKNVGT